MTDRASMYERAMGARFDRLSAAVQRFHRLAGKHELSGWVETVAPHSLVGKALAVCLGTPMRSHQGPIRFVLDAGPDRETWTRIFPDKTMRSSLQLEKHAVVERLGFARLTFELHERDGMLVMDLVHLHVLGVPCPSWLMPRVVAEETGLEDRVEFKVSAAVPLLGVIAGYHGHLMLPFLSRP